MATCMEQLSWNVRVLSSGGDPDEGTAYLVACTDASDDAQAVQRVLDYVGRNFEDDLRGARTEVVERNETKHIVRVNLARPR